MSDAKNQQVVETLGRLLADSYTLYLKTHNYHWNVTGPMFTTLHSLFEVQYTELATAIDEIAERIRSLGAYAPGSLTEFAPLSVVKDETGRPNDTQMIRTLVEDSKNVTESARKVILSAEESGDQASADLGTRRIDIHEKNAWMLRSHLSE